MKRVLALILALLLMLSLAACGDKDDNHDDHDYDKKDDSSSASNKWKPSIKDIIANNQEDIEAVLDREIYVFKNSHPELYTIESAITVTSISYVENWTFGQVLNEENYKDIDWEVDTFESGSKVVTFTGKCQMTGYSETAVYNFYIQDGADFPIVTSIWLGPIEDVSEAGPPLGYPTEDGDTELSVITTDARCSWWIALYSGGGITASGYDDERKPIISDKFAIHDFCNMAYGVWVDKSTCKALDYGDVMFSFCVFADEGLCFGDYPGSYSRVGKIVNVEEISDGEYNVTLFYQEEEYFGDIYEESYEDGKLFFDDDSLQFENSDIVYTYMGKDLENAKQSVSDYLTNYSASVMPEPSAIITTENFESEVDLSVRENWREVGIFPAFYEKVYTVQSTYSYNYIGTTYSTFQLPEMEQYDYIGFDVYKLEAPNGWCAFYLVPYNEFMGPVPNVYAFYDGGTLELVWIG